MFSLGAPDVNSVKESYNYEALRKKLFQKIQESIVIDHEKTKHFFLLLKMDGSWAILVEDNGNNRRQKYPF